jgi:hypothetical protein
LLGKQEGLPGTALRNLEMVAGATYCKFHRFRSVLRFIARWRHDPTLTVRASSIPGDRIATVVHTLSACLWPCDVRSIPEKLPGFRRTRGVREMDTRVGLPLDVNARCSTHLVRRKNTPVWSPCLPRVGTHGRMHSYSFRTMLRVPETPVSASSLFRKAGCGSGVLHGRENNHARIHRTRICFAASCAL